MTINRLAATLLVALALAGCASQTETASSFNVFFTQNATALSPDGQAIVAQAADAIRRLRSATVTIAASNEPRYEAVRAALVARGVAPGSITRASLPQIEANAGATAAQRVEIILSPNP